MARTRNILIGVIMAIFVCIFFAMIIVSFWGMTRQESMSFIPAGDKIAIIDIFGPIEYSENIVRQLKKFGNDNSVPAIILRIDSPGGAVAPTQEIFNQVLRVREEGTYVIASVASLAASGGYYIACAADTVFANPGSLIGSIGVIFSFLTLEGLMEKVGVELEVVKSGNMKDIGNYSREMSQQERDMLQSALDDVYSQFVMVISEQRDIDIYQVEDIADGSVFTGNQALDLGLVDKVGGLEDAINFAGEITGMGDDPKTVKEYLRKKNVFDYLAENAASVLNITGGENSRWPRLEYLYK